MVDGPVIYKDMNPVCKDIFVSSSLDLPANTSISYRNTSVSMLPGRNQYAAVANVLPKLLSARACALFNETFSCIMPTLHCKHESTSSGHAQRPQCGSIIQR